MSALLLCNLPSFRGIFSTTAVSQQRLTGVVSFTRYLSSKDENRVKKSGSKYKDTVLLPKTEFPLWLDSRHRAKHDNDILQQCGFSTFYKWQRENLKGKEFVLHDGPPYANGSPHVGHAVNKILKDIVMRHELLKGRHIHYVPGWDCHGLPIELKAVSEKDSKDGLSPLQIRQRARKFASETIEKQRQIFRSWGILGDWDENCYFTYDKNYVQNQLRKFYSMFEKGFVYRDMKPIYWSPSSKTALAEAELQYNPNHKSTCVTVRVQLRTKPFNVEIDGPLFALIWTTTPWTLPANEAVVYNSKLEYSIVKIENFDGLYIIASNLLTDLEKNLCKKVKVIQTIPGKSLKRATYSHPLYKQEEHKFFHADHVTGDKGTGLVHCAPSHGREDYIVAVENNLKLVSLVDKEGNYLETAGAHLVGKSIMGDGASTVRELLKSDIIHTEELIHSYPYDWRTNKPVFLVASEQWFFDCSAVKDDAMNLLSEVQYAPDGIHSTAMTSLVRNRPFWCISRQRVWGVPIPVLFKRECKTPIISKSLIEHYCDLIEEHGTDFWWVLPTEKLCPSHLAAELNVQVSEIERCHDILDIWFDSGLSWSAVLEGRTADVYLEGSDQLTGWFQSSLLTSVALHGKAPFRKIFTHGFVVDENGIKMSKSVGNVIDPCILTSGGKDLKKEPAFGVDTLRWWVAAHSVQNANIPMSMNLMKSSYDIIQKLRGTIKYAVGALHDLPSKTVENIDQLNLFMLDKYMLHGLENLREEVNNYYSNHKYNLACTAINNFVVHDVSNLYFTLTKDRLFCDDAASEKRRAVQVVIFHILETLLELIAPVTPLLVEETYNFHPLHAERRFFEHRSQNPTQFEKRWSDGEIESSILSALSVRKIINKMSEGKSTWGLAAEVQCSIDNMKLLEPLLESKTFKGSQLEEILQVGSVKLQSINEETASDTLFKVNLSPLNIKLCARCRRFGSSEESDICIRCMDVLDASLNALKHSYH
ncbi:hypothetical protein ONE63_007385 [Megalurothrips usitatus]|uniref:isoleucine--tRNA ligase n=1 Tax=Megalurothrips usitatus TaxID=439358 RepID=A0AAV7XMJ7_9NEOP|nr:hypothetical protein ONE63_007385 [Megalurothrips usitatus]